MSKTKKPDHLNPARSLSVPNTDREFVAITRDRRSCG
jgi:hypothetical protein